MEQLQKFLYGTVPEIKKLFYFTFVYKEITNTLLSGWTHIYWIIRWPRQHASFMRGLLVAEGLYYFHGACQNVQMFILIEKWTKVDARGGGAMFDFGRKRSEKVFQTNWTNKFIYTKMSIHMFLSAVFVFQSVVFVLEDEIDLLQQHMAI